MLGSYTKQELAGELNLSTAQWMKRYED